MFMFFDGSLSLLTESDSSTSSPTITYKHSELYVNVLGDSDKRQTFLSVLILHHPRMDSSPLLLYTMFWSSPHAHWDDYFRNPCISSAKLHQVLHVRIQDNNTLSTSHPLFPHQGTLVFRHTLTVESDGLNPVKFNKFWIFFKSTALLHSQ